MKGIVAILFLALAGLSVVMAQDIITLKSGKELKARLIKLNPRDVVFIPEDSSDTVYLLRDEITQLQYRSGIIIYLSEAEIPALISDPGNDSLYTLGEIDAARYYKGYKTAAISTMIASVWFPLGLIPAIACSATPPSKYNLGYKDQKLMENSSYFNGYTLTAHKIKKKKVWGGFAIGSGFVIGLSIVMSGIVITSF